MSKVKKHKDMNQIAFMVVKMATEGSYAESKPKKDAPVKPLKKVVSPKK